MNTSSASATTSRFRVDFIDAKGGRWCWVLLGSRELATQRAEAACRSHARDRVRVTFEVRDAS